MALYYLDTSALVKLYVREQGTERLLALASPSGEHRLAVLSLSRVELRSAIRRRQRAGDIPQDVSDQVLNLFRIHLETKFLTQTMTETVLDTATILIDRHILRAYDAVQLAGCLALKTVVGADVPVFVCSDRDLLMAAASEGLPTMDPGASFAFGL